MKRNKTYNILQFIVSISMILITCVVSYVFVDIIGYQVVALVLLLVVSVAAMLYDIVPVLLTALISALVWNYFFIPPVGTFHIGKPEDVLLFLMYFVIAMINAVLTFKIKEFERKSRDKEEKEHTIKLYDTLLNSLSHELRTPISTIIGAVDIMEAQDNKLTDNNRHELISEIKIAGLRLNRQVENLLSISRLEAGILKPRLDWCDINELIFSVIRMYDEELYGHIIKFEPDENIPLVKVDRVLIEHILQNLIFNAIVHTPAETVITIVAAFKDESLHLLVTDTGNGFPAPEIDHVFNKFYRLNQSNPGGTGLGLSIVKGFTEILNGKIKLENLSSGGVIFTIIIPSESSSYKDTDHE